MVTKAEMKKLQERFHKKMLASPDIHPSKPKKIKPLGTVLFEKNEKRKKGWKRYGWGD